jgi:hypothetical protein
MHKNGSVETPQRKGTFEMAFNIAVFVLFTAMWLAFAIALVSGPGNLDRISGSFRELPLMGQAVTGLLFLPVVAGLWVWETSWPYLIRLVLVAGLAWWNIFIFWPFRS